MMTMTMMQQGGKGGVGVVGGRSSSFVDNDTTTMNTMMMMQEFYNPTTLWSFLTECLNWQYTGVYWPYGSEGKQYGVDFFYNIDEIVRYCQKSQFHYQYAKEYQHWWNMKFTSNDKKRMCFGRMMGKNEDDDGNGAAYHRHHQQQPSRKKARHDNTTTTSSDVPMMGMNSHHHDKVVVSEFMSFNFATHHNNKENTQNSMMESD